MRASLSPLGRRHCRAEQGGLRAPIRVADTADRFPGHGDERVFKASARHGGRADFAVAAAASSGREAAMWPALIFAWTQGLACAGKVFGGDGLHDLASLWACGCDLQAGAGRCGRRRISRLDQRPVYMLLASDLGPLYCGGFRWQATGTFTRRCRPCCRRAPRPARRCSPARRGCSWPHG
jgi:hypothetical protein